MQASKSESLRAIGNKFYQKAKDLDVKVLKLLSFKDAINAYNQAISCATNANEFLSETKNLGVTYRLIFNLEDNFESQIYYLEESSKAFVQICLKKDESKTDAWYLEIHGKLTNNIADLNELLIRKKDLKRERNAYYERQYKICKPLCLSYSVIILVDWLENLKKEIIESVCQVKLKNAMYVIKETYTPLTLLEQSKNCDQKTIMEWKILFEKFNNMYTALESKINADLLKTELLSTVEDNIEQALEVVDAYNYTLMVIGKSNDIEIEAECLSLAGQVYYKYLRNIPFAKRNFSQAIKLGFSLHPKNVTDKIWFKLAEKYATEIVEKENLDALNKVSEILNKYKEKFDHFRTYFHKRNVEVQGSFEYLFKTFPPKLPIPVFEENMEYQKKVRLAIKVYHPDVSNGQSEEEKIVFEEIAKLLIAHISTKEV